MTNMATGIIGIGLVLAFLGFMLAWVQALPLIIIVTIVMLLLIYDFVQEVRAGKDDGGK